MFAYYLVLLAQNLILTIGAGPARFFGKILGKLAWSLDRRHRPIALQNLKLAFPDRSPSWHQKIGRASFAGMGFNLVEFLRTPKLAGRDLSGLFRFQGWEAITKARARGKGIIFVTFHFGNWEYLGFIPRFFDFPAAVVTQEIKNPALDGLVSEIREMMGVEILPKTESSATLLNLLRHNGAVAIVADQRARKMGSVIEFLGRPAATTSAPAVLALRSEAALLPVFIAFDGQNGYQVTFENEIEIPGGLSRPETIKEITIRINRVLEKRIKFDPQLWLWGHRRWLNSGK